MSEPRLATIVSNSALDEETARAEIYGLLARLYYAPPDPALMAALRASVTQAPAAGAYLEEPWRGVVAAARALDDAAVAQEHDTLFGGIGKPEVYLFGSHYLSGFLNEKPLVRLRTDLAALGLGRDDAMSETEDHVAYLCEAMRYLIAGDDVEVANLTRQRQFFSDHLMPWVPMLCTALAEHPQAHFYSSVAGFSRAFREVESQGFDMLA